jgi:hypothetical protein
MPSSKIRTGAAALAALVIASAAGYWTWTEHKKRELRRNVAALVQDTSARLREALQARASLDSAALRKLDADAGAIDGRAGELRRMRASPDRTLVYAAEEYALNARQLLRNLAQAHRQRQRLAESMKLLSHHMNYANRRASNWHREALRLKDGLDRNYSDYSRAVEALGRELDAYPETHAKLAAQVGASLLPDEALAAEARQRSTDAARQAAAEMQRARNMTGGR